MVQESQITKFITVTIRVSDVLEADAYSNIDKRKELAVRTISKSYFQYIQG